MSSMFGLEEVAARQHGLLARTQVLSKMSRSALRHRVDAGEFTRWHRTVYRVRGTPVTWTQQAFGLTLLCGPGSALSHGTAAFLWGLDGFREPQRIDVTMPIGKRITAPPHCIHHSRRAVFSQPVHGLRVTSVAKTLIDLADDLPDQALEIALDSANRRYRALPARIQTLVNDLQNHGLHGVSRLMRLLGKRTHALDSALEVKVLRALERTRIPRPRTRYVTRRDDGSYLLRLDFCWPEVKVALHVDSFQFHFFREGFDRDAEQRFELTALGWTNLSVTSTALANNAWIRLLTTTLTNRGLPCT